ncbi:hypothetical protein BpHYR1_019184 [Brachionus plicatilis]|uniref:Uncharacterized protein n=1 Tax=Brachionus plicatilis TaxID=10195 RepID=A0A3M7QQS6_BRAPC|nr:hypothetical protein BpHYR1_019184 [Brachionus plicatilis]
MLNEKALFRIRFGKIKFFFSQSSMCDHRNWKVDQSNPSKIKHLEYAIKESIRHGFWAVVENMNPIFLSEKIKL